MKTRCGRHKKFDILHINYLKELLSEDYPITLKTMKTKLHEIYGIDVSVSTIDRSLNEFHYSFKRIALIPEK